jgi:UDPglucose 6-dehydrogenase/GDP-mannose 6-dehydrogenase
MRIAIVGAGYVGLVTGACLAEKGHQVVCVDVDRDKVDKINRAVPPIHERDLGALLQKHVDARLRATTDLPRSVMESDVSFIAVGTPFAGGEIDLSAIRQTACQIGTALREKSAYHVVAVKSTVVPGTTDEVVTPILERASGKAAGVDFGVGANPEFLTEGQAIDDFMAPDRIVLGGRDERSRDVLADVYRAFAGVPQLRTTNKTAEMIKYASNALLATLISFSNEIGNLCAALGGVDVVDVMRGLHLSKDISPLLPDGQRIRPPIAGFLWAGCGFGGSCLPKDVRALTAQGREAGRAMRLLEAVMRINDEQPREIGALLRKHFASLENVRIAILGLAFKPGTDDMRESPAMPIIRDLLAQGAAIRAYDPVAVPSARRLFQPGEVTLCDDLAQAIDGVQAIVLVTRWDEFRRLPELLADREPQPVVVDGRRMLDRHSIARYEGIGL